MKRLSMLVLCLLVLGVFGLSSNVFAATVFETSGTIDIGPTAGSTTIGLSPKVYAYYTNPGTDEPTAQWFAVSTAHPGGNTMYGTAQDVNNIYQQTYVTGTELTTTNMATPAVAGSAAAWTDAGWGL